MINFLLLFASLGHAGTPGNSCTPTYVFNDSGVCDGSGVAIPPVGINLSTVTAALAEKLPATAPVPAILIDLSTVTIALAERLSTTAPIAPLLVDLSTTQARVTGTCAAGSSIRVIDAAGLVTCETDDTGSASWNEVEIDFGSKGVFVSSMTITDAAVTATSKIIVSPSGIAATGRQADENEMDGIHCRAIPRTGTFDLICSVERSVTHGKFKVNYQAN